MLSGIRSNLSRINSRINYELACWQGFCPTKKEIDNSEIVSLARRLKSDSPEDTLTNILDWQGRNISFWTERHPLGTLATRFAPWGSLIFVIGLIPAVILSNFLTTNLVIWYIALSVTVLLTGTILILGIIMTILHSNTKIPIFQGLRNAFSFSIPLNALLENKLGVCRDCAKLTASLLLNIYKDMNPEIYFAYAPNHVATGIVINKKLYMLDQRLPVLTIDKWKTYRHLKHKLGKLEGNTLREIDPKQFLSKNNLPPLTQSTMDDLNQTMTSLLNIEKQSVDERHQIVKVKWRKGALLYQNEEMVNYSLSRWLKAKVLTELLEQSRITKIEAISQKEDIIFCLTYNKQAIEDYSI